MVVAVAEMGFGNDRPSKMVKLGGSATLECCCKKDWKGNQATVTWFARIYKGNNSSNGSNAKIKDKDNPKEITTLNSTEDITIDNLMSPGRCGKITFKSVKLEDTGIYHCSFTHLGSPIYSHGTYMHVYSECLCVCYDVR